MSLADRYPLLATIDSPADLRRLPESQLEPLARELRDFLVHTVSQMGGHFAAGLGTVELTVALHYVYDTPRDRLVWDVGHQAYPHKVITGRRDRLQTIKLKDGLAPFPHRRERVRHLRRRPLEHVDQRGPGHGVGVCPGR
jgi:1-deoxy-D-xylulose-5-phosphate synthase